MAVFEKAQSATPQQEVSVSGFELWHTGVIGRIQKKKQLVFFHIMLLHFVRYDVIV